MTYRWRPIPRSTSLNTPGYANAGTDTTATRSHEPVYVKCDTGNYKKMIVEYSISYEVFNTMTKYSTPRSALAHCKTAACLQPAKLSISCRVLHGMVGLPDLATVHDTSQMQYKLIEPTEGRYHLACEMVRGGRYCSSHSVRLGRSDFLARLAMRFLPMTFCLLESLSAASTSCCSISFPLFSR